MHEKILIVEDERTIQDFLAFSLKKEGYSVVCASDGRQALDCFGRESPDMVLLDLMLPQLDGIDVLKTLRGRNGEVPILVVTARDEEADKVCGLELGADDYITKPFSTRELIARIRANLRKRQVSGRARLGDLEVDWGRAEVFDGEVRIFLTAKEFELLRALHQNRDRVLTRDWLLERIWGFDFEGDARVVDTTVKRLRKKLRPDVIETVRGLGYRLLA